MPPGVAKAPEALRGAGLFRRLLSDGAVDAGVVLPGRYRDDDATRPEGVLRNEAAIIDHARALANRLRAILATGQSPLVIGGDCSLLVGAGLGLAHSGRVGLVHVDGHTDFRHPGNSDACASLAGEDLAAAVGMHRPMIANIDGSGPYFSADKTVHIGCRDSDAFLDELRSTLSRVIPASESFKMGMAEVASATRSMLSDADGYWLHVDVDVLDPAVMPAVDSPDPGGLAADDLVQLLRHLAPSALGAQATVFDPDLDPDGTYARLLTDIIVDGLSELGPATTL